MILYIHVLIYDVIEIKRRSMTMILIIIGNNMFFFYKSEGIYHIAVIFHCYV